ncbi:transcriptional regulator, TetR family [Hyphomonas neptunium ATCC 15444]|uniref:Transcriptional regulator, TetR family n=2 Tax=Hyphomonas TaxID=85 RepID=Q0C684_HYPNA|nr:MULTISPECIES: TetR/AcrR family transcriptional regulator [Hyphomonas]ABI75995.1 transcriptional regulator, TetR family [Hyphomonas neptunium ATCC 15444]KCZ94839.1 TetR family transcriptional regulator [Hyphomonas hirschiana VP5]
MARTANPHTRDNLMEAAFKLVREKGLTATTVDEICAAAGVSKGAFFHHFKSKEELAVAAAHHWSAVTGGFFDNAPYHQPEDPLERLLGYIALRREMMDGEIADFTCFVGTMAQEAWATSPPVAAAAWDSMAEHAEKLAVDIDAAKAARGIAGDWSARSLALHIGTVTQGAFILAKASGDASIAQDSLDHLRRYIEALFEAPAPAAKS